MLRRNCTMYIHGHSAGGTNPSLVEAMCLNLPIISFDVSYNRATTENSALYFKNKEDLIYLIEKIDNNSLIENANKMTQISARRYQWQVIANKYKNLIYTFDYKYTKQSTIADISSIDSTYLQKRGLAHLISPQEYYQNEEL